MRGREVKLMLPSPADSGLDALARRLAQKLSDRLDRWCLSVAGLTGFCRRCSMKSKAK
jgi:hypothetical protein